MSKTFALMAAVVFICIPAGLFFFRGRNIPSTYSSNHYDGTRFFNAEPDHTFAEHPEKTIDAHETDLADALKRHAVDESAFRILDFGEGVLVPEKQNNCIKKEKCHEHLCNRRHRTSREKPH